MLDVDVDPEDELVVNKILQDPPGQPSNLSKFSSSSDGDEIEPVEGKPGLQFLQGAENGNIDLMTQLLEADPTLISFKDSDCYTALHRAAYSDQVKTVKFLLDHGADISARTDMGWTPLHSACRWNASRCVSILSKNGADINALTSGGLTPLHVAAENAIARETLIVLLLDPNLDTNLKNSSGETGEQIATQHGSLSYLFELVRKSIIDI